MNIEYKIADTIPDIIELLRLRIEVFVLEQEGPVDEEPDIYDKESTFIVAEEAGTIVGVARFRPVGDMVKIERIAVKKSRRGKGIGKGLVIYALRLIGEKHSGVVYLHAQKVAEGFYRKLGFQPVGETFMEAGIEHIKMIREI